jgi:hypothetical protein
MRQGINHHGAHIEIFAGSVDRLVGRDVRQATLGAAQALLWVFWFLCAFSNDQACRRTKTQQADGAQPGRLS